MADNDHEIPDFLDDDFANDKEILRLRKGTSLDRELIDESVAVLRAAFNFVGSDAGDMEDFVMLSNLKAFTVESHHCVSDHQKILALILEYSSAYPTGKSSNSGTDLYLFGRLTLPRKYPKTYICKETIREKLMELFMKRETDFAEHGKFSARFHVLTEDPARLTDLLRLAPMEELIRFPDLELEIQGDQCFYRDAARPLSTDRAASFVELTRILLRVFR